MHAELGLEVGVRVVAAEVGKDGHDHLHVQWHVSILVDGHQAEKALGVDVFFGKVQGVHV